MIEWVLPLDIVTPNVCEHWAKSYARNNKNARLMALQWALVGIKPEPPLMITLERLYNSSKRHKPYDMDNLISAFKGIRDAVADLIIPGLKPGRADATAYGLNWQYLQTDATKKGVRIKIRTIEEFYADQLNEALEARNEQIAQLKGK